MMNSVKKLTNEKGTTPHNNEWLEQLVSYKFFYVKDINNKVEFWSYPIF